MSSILQNSTILSKYRHMRKLLIWDMIDHPITILACRLKISREQYLSYDDDVGIDMTDIFLANRILSCYGLDLESLTTSSTELFKNILDRFMSPDKKRKITPYTYLLAYDHLARLNVRSLAVPDNFYHKYPDDKSYMCLDYNISVSFSHVNNFPYIDHNLRLVSFDIVLLSIICDTIMNVNIDDIRKGLHNCEKNKDIYYSLDSKSEISVSKWRTLNFRDEKYKVGSNSDYIFHKQMVAIQKNINPEEYRLQWVLLQIKNIPIDQYFNCDTHRYNKKYKTEHICLQYSIISQNPETIKFWQEQCQKCGIPVRAVASSSTSSSSNIPSSSTTSNNNTSNNNTSNIASSSTSSNIASSSSTSNTSNIASSSTSNTTSNIASSSTTSNNTSNNINKRKSIPSTIRHQVWEIVNGDKMTGFCFCCDRSLHFRDHQSGHILAVVHGGKNTIDNLRPICGSCNRSMSSKHMYEFMQEYSLPGLRHFRLN